MAIDRGHEAARRHLRRADPVLRGVIASVGVYKIQYRSDRFLALVEAIVAQQVSVKAARAILQRLTARFPEGLTPDRLRRTSPDVLRAVGLSRQKSDYLLGLAEKVADGELRLSALHDLDDAEVAAQLTRVKGIGRWTVEMFLIFCLRRRDVLPVGDLGFRKAVRTAYGLETDPDAGHLERLAEPWRPYRSIATCYLWASIEPDPW